MQEVLDRISKARSWLVINQPFVATLALSMKVELTDKLETAGATYETLYFNPDFVSTLSDDELVFLVAHEVFHPMFEHNSRRMGRDPKQWNVAADIVINEHLINERIGKMPSGGLYEPALFKAAEGSTDAVYDLLPPQQGQGQGQGQGQPSPKAPWDDIIESEGSPAEVTAQEQDMKVRASQAAQAAKMSGKLSAGMKRLFTEIMTPKVNWQDVLRDFVVKAHADSRSYARPNRRFMHLDILMPSVSGEAMGEIVIAVDCSGSVDEKLLASFAAEISVIHDECLPSKTHIVYFDSKVCHHDEYERDDQVKVTPHGGGGTRFSPIFQYAEAKDINPVCCVVLTDLDCSDFGSEPEYPVLWVSTQYDKAPWGEVIKM